MTTSHVSRWLLAARLRTLPLACSCVLLGSGLAAHDGVANPAVLVFSLLTAILLQILSNLANDYGDAVSGADNAARVGPLRAVSSGLISARQMRMAMLLTTLLTVVSGLWLLWLAFAGDWPAILGFIGLGALALLAAVAYTVGRNPYGYRGLGDLSVFLFFGLLGVLGTYYLYAHRLYPALLLPASSCGLLATAVLNINNIRDRLNDAASGKRTLAVRLGAERARVYHWCLVGTAGLFHACFIVWQCHSFWPWLFVPGYLPVLQAARMVQCSTEPGLLNQQLKKTALASLACNLLLAIGLAI